MKWLAVGSTAYGLRPTAQLPAPAGCESGSGKVLILKELFLLSSNSESSKIWRAGIVPAQMSRTTHSALAPAGARTGALIPELQVARSTRDTNRPLWQVARRPYGQPSGWLWAL